jgi:hypothetical protein
MSERQRQNDEAKGDFVIHDPAYYSDDAKGKPAPNDERLELERLRGYETGYKQGTKQAEAVLRELIEWWRGDVIDLPALVTITDKAREILKNNHEEVEHGVQ